MNDKKMRIRNDIKGQRIQLDHNTWGSITTLGFSYDTWYEGHDAVTIYDPVTSKPLPHSYVVKNDLGRLVKVKADLFITLDHWRQNQISKIQG